MVANSYPLRSLAWSQLPLCPLHLPHPSHPFPSKKDINLHTDDINMPAASVGHTPLLMCCRLHTLIFLSSNKRAVSSIFSEGAIVPSTWEICILHGYFFNPLIVVSSSVSLAFLVSRGLLTQHLPDFLSHLLHHLVDPIKGRHSQLEQCSPEGVENSNSASSVP